MAHAERHGVAVPTDAGHGVPDIVRLALAAERLDPLRALGQRVDVRAYDGTLDSDSGLQRDAVAMAAMQRVGIAGALGGVRGRPGGGLSPAHRRGERCGDGCRGRRER